MAGNKSGGPAMRIKLKGKNDAQMTATNREILYWTAIGILGVDASPADVADDDVGCAESVNAICRKALGIEVGGDLSTTRMYQALRESSRFVRVETPLKGDIIISPTGFGNGNLSNGHVGIMGDEGRVMSNTSATGLWTQNYTLESWRERYGKLGGYPVLFYRVLG